MSFGILYTVCSSSWSFLFQSYQKLWDRVDFTAKRFFIGSI